MWTIKCMGVIKLTHFLQPLPYTRFTDIKGKGRERRTQLDLLEEGERSSEIKGRMRRIGDSFSVTTSQPFNQPTRQTDSL